MKDLLVYVADTEASAFMQSILNKPEALEIRPITFDIRVHPQRDSGMVQSSAELSRMIKNDYRKALLMWDHHGSGRENRQKPSDVGREIQNKLDAYNWKGRSAVHVFFPELEEWIWFCESAILAHTEISSFQLQGWIDTYSQKIKMTPDEVKSQQPKELFEYVMRDCIKKTISPRNFEKIGSLAGIKGLMQCDSFRLVVEQLQVWFPR